MPVEVKELIIRATAAASDESAADPCNATGGDDTADNDQDALVEACVRQVLEILKKERER
uniref:Uncharacterized protein n=2 Tax=unclassified Candidatus Kentrum TaxID=2643149 RepID=A0A451AX64_9GAMM|nr:MAG: hypothetical protein BECKLPF1236B_GA0070989_100418 [Candidatus Kentron sp. LPFa]VFK62421.1 MAG: hypothetical protein BECKUNK1418G_GA0071005_10247 [Candidatus Kentron sp. UNK]VFK70497.1 MAG: hypothetical protein BECKUNK1418H_GA0071006_10307 [Candidatus Kentron sp. UNK]